MTDLKITNDEDVVLDDEVDITNWWWVGINGLGAVSVGQPPTGAMSREKALVLAAWLVAIAEVEVGQFDAILNRVRNT